MRSRLSLDFLLFIGFTPIFIFVATPCAGQMAGNNNPSSGHELSGTVRDAASGQALDHVRVDLVSKEVSHAFTFTSADGQFRFSGLPNGQYDIQVDADGFESYDQTVDVAQRSVFDINVDLKRAAGATPSAPGASISAHQLGVPPKAQKEFDKAVAQMNSKGDMHAAISGFDRAIQDFPDYYEAYTMEGVAYIAISDTASAERVLRKSIELSSGKYPAALYTLAGLLNTSNRFQEAEAMARQCLALDEASWHAHIELAKALLGLGSLDEALTNAQRARDLEPKNPKTFLVLANIHGAQRNYPAFLQDLDNYLVLDPTGAMADQVRKKRDQIQQALTQAQTNASPSSKPAQ
jgi:type IV pilus assembly protein PilF